ncbi:MAG: hypothetical protein HY319_04360 [Armatimonadetes bacterium]|nr:hypothetical protein [Armatimonadota bacterium]
MQRQVIGQRQLPGGPSPAASPPSPPGDRTSLSPEVAEPVSRGVETLIRELQLWEIEEQPDRPGPRVPGSGGPGGPEPALLARD